MRSGDTKERERERERELFKLPLYDLSSWHRLIAGEQLQRKLSVRPDHHLHNLGDLVLALK